GGGGVEGDGGGGGGRGGGGPPPWSGGGPPGTGTVRRLSLRECSSTTRRSPARMPKRSSHSTPKPASPCGPIRIPAVHTAAHSAPAPERPPPRPLADSSPMGSPGS